MSGDQSSPPFGARHDHADSRRTTTPPGARHARSADRSPQRSDIRLTLPARPENVSVVRHVLGALGDALALPTEVVEDMRLAVTEACTNVVRHAYAGGDGSIEVVVRPEGDALRVTVADAGRGIGPSPDTAGPGLGLPLIAALTDSLEIERAGATGSRLIMSFRRTRGSHAVGRT
jgi:anti-sigma regulatory factor (Ser/Thr protein kinase)